VTSILLAATVSLLIALFGTPVAIRSLRARGIGQIIREDGPHAHFSKHGTPTMGGLVIIGGAVAGYVASHLRPGTMTPFSASGLLAMGTVLALGLLGLTDDLIKIRRRRSLGLNKTAKIVGQVVIALVFAWFAARYTQADRHISFVRPVAIQLGIVLFAIWVFVIISGASNGVNLADGLDGLACGSGVMVMGAYVIIAFWQFRHACGTFAQQVCYIAPHSLDLALVAASLLGAGLGFLWWNAAPARIFMGDTGSLALGGAMASLAILTNTQLLLAVLGGLYVIEGMSVILQVISYRLYHRRIFLMAPVHHHFELLGWPEFTVIVRFWILAGLAIAFGLGLFYAEFIARGGLG
jgi:phospho-N-acetylmuramoyl-pentapeptide-transferase